MQDDQHYEPIQDALLTRSLYEEVLLPSSSLQVQENLNVTSGHTSVTNENYTSASVRLTMPVPLLSREIVTSQNEAYGCAIGTSGQGCAIRSGEHLINVPKYVEEQAFPQLERDVNKPQADPYYHSCGTSGETGINENRSSSLSNYEEVTPPADSYEEITPPTTPQRKEGIERLENEANIVGKFNTESISISVPKYMEEQAFPLLERDVNEPQADHSCGTSGQTGINENCSSSLSSCEDLTPPTTPQRKEDIETLENETYNCFDANIVGKFNTTQASCARESTNT